MNRKERYIVTAISVGAAGLTQRPAVFDTLYERTVKVYRKNEEHLATKKAKQLNLAYAIAKADDQ